MASQEQALGQALRRRHAATTGGASDSNAGSTYSEFSVGGSRCAPGAHAALLPAGEAGTGLPVATLRKDYGFEVDGNFARRRNFCVREGEVVEIINMEDDQWWSVRRAAGDRAKGWLPAALLRLCARRNSASSRMLAGSEEWAAFSECGAEEQEEDSEVAKLLSYKRIIDVRLRDSGRHTSKMPAEFLFDHPATHAAMALVLALQLCHAWRTAPSPLSSVGCALTALACFVAAFMGVDLMSTVYHIALDYALFATNDTTVTDLHHKLPLNYNIFSVRELLAVSYLPLAPLHVVHALVFLCSKGLRTSPCFAMYLLSFSALAETCGYVHNAAHRRRHKLWVPAAICVLQDARILLHPDVHSSHHRGDHDAHYSLFSGLTHPFSDRLVFFLRKNKLLPPTAEQLAHINND